ncbi:hypothetical protein CLG96_03655 [Sphingomonas oleivorans]|uniref:Peptidase n=1 Tax=Sphingomonas oleivorans TaxID=1735121 RepID=A0A2T5G252_9SPHN|nr:PepSY-associated TM helix domain-containing protein [Sphingomonas oleivorans]PTQ13227.1 hypothetical protein CLG96_03655 [Sphingomonas oleivorans]
MARRHWLLVHRWTALALGLHWLLLALTGFLLVFHREIETTWIGAGSPVAGPVRVGPAIAAAQEALPGRVTRVVVQDMPVRALRVFVNVRDVPHVVTVDAESSRILSATPLDGGASRTGIIRFIYVLHQQLLLGHNGELLVGASGLFLLLTALIGVWLGWPRRGQWKRTLWPRVAGKPWQKLYVLHRSAGLIVAVTLTLSAMTGAGMVWSKQLRQWLGAAGLAQPASSTVRSDAPVRLSPDGAVARALLAYPQAHFVRLDLPAPGAANFVVQMRQPGELRATFGTTAVSVDGRDGNVLWQRDARQAAWGDTVLDALFAVHNGEWLGVPGRILAALVGLLLLVTAGFGLGIWLLRPARR